MRRSCSTESGGVIMQALSTAKSGERYTIKWMLGNQKVMDFLHRHDFCEGNPIDVILRNNDWMIIGNDMCRVAIGCEVADRIQV